MTFLCTGVLSRLNAFSGLALQYSLSQQTITIPTNYNHRALNQNGLKGSSDPKDFLNQCRIDADPTQNDPEPEYLDRLKID